MLILAATTSTIERLSHIPPQFWLRLGCAIAAIIALVFALRKFAKMNKVVVGVVSAVAVSMIGFNWIYERNEPSWASPAVNWMAGFFPTKGTAHNVGR